MWDVRTKEEVKEVHNLSSYEPDRIWCSRLCDIRSCPMHVCHATGNPVCSADLFDAEKCDTVTAAIRYIQEQTQDVMNGF